MHAALLAKSPEVIGELFSRIHTRMHEILFENAPLIKRMHCGLFSLEDWKNAQTDNDKLPIIRQVFAMHLAIRLFGSDDVTNYKMISLLAGDNLRELIYRCDELVCDLTFRACIASISGCSSDEVNIAFKDSMQTPEEMTERFTLLNKVFVGLTAKLPVREYKRVDEIGDMEDPTTDESVSF
jgi:hypothetical protein